MSYAEEQEFYLAYDRLKQLTRALKSRYLQQDSEHGGTLPRETVLSAMAALSDRVALVDSRNILEVKALIEDLQRELAELDA